MRKLFIIIFSILLMQGQVFAWSFNNTSEEDNIRTFLNNQVKYANHYQYDKFISTYDPSYKNYDGLNFEDYSDLVKNLWKTYHNIKYSIKIKDINIKDDQAQVALNEYTTVSFITSEQSKGTLNSTSDSIYYLQKSNGQWKVISDRVIDETTDFLCGDAKNLNIKLIVPQSIKPNTEFTAALEFTPPAGTIAIASLTSDIIEYPQQHSKEVFRVMPDDHILERLFTSNNTNHNEYIMASIGITKSEVADMSLKVTFTGYGYTIKRVNVEKTEQEQNIAKTND